MGIGGIAVDPARAEQIRADLLAIHKECQISENAEVKWSNLKKRRVCPQTAYVKYLFKCIEAGHIHFHVRFSPFKQYDHTKSGTRKESDTISKAFYQLLLWRAGKFYGDKRRISIRADDGDCTAYLPNMKAGLNTAISGKFKFEHACIAEITPCDSRSDRMLQLLDVSLGALTAARNGSHVKEGVSERKKDLIKLALELAKVSDIAGSHPSDAAKLNIWNVKPMW